MLKNKELVPPGYKYRNELMIYAVVLFMFMVLLPLNTFFNRFNWAVESWSYPDAFPDINYFLRGCFSGLVLMIAVCIYYALDHYRSYAETAKSIYTMKRINDPWLLPKQCLFLPLMALLVSLAVMAVLLIVFKNCYMNVPAGITLPPYEGINIWRAII